MKNSESTVIDNYFAHLLIKNVVGTLKNRLNEGVRLMSTQITCLNDGKEKHSPDSESQEFKNLS